MQISNSEKVVMDVLWQESPKSAQEITLCLEKVVDWHEKTTKTLLNRLTKKEAIGYEKRGREYFYFPILKEAEYIKNASESFLNRVFNGNVGSLVTAFAKNEKLSSSDIEDLKGLLKEIEND